MAGTVVFIESVSNDGGDPGATVAKVFDGSTISGWVSSASVGTNTDNFLTGSSSISDKVSNATQTGYGLGAGVVGEPWDFSVGGTDEGNHVFMIINASGTRDTLANGGYGIIVADDLGTDSFGTWYVGPQANSLGGWEYYVIDPTQDFDAVTAGTATWTLTGNPAQLSGVDGIGVRWKITNTVMGASDNAFVQTGSIGVGYRITGTDAVFSEISTYENTNRFGALRTIAGILFPICKIRIGTPSGAGNTTFVDSGFTVTWEGQTLSDGTTKATATGFYGIFGDQGTGTTDITLSNGSFAATSPEEFDMDLSGINSATLTNVNVDRARIVTLDSAVSWAGGTIKNSGQVDCGSGADLVGCIIQDYTGAADTSSLVWDVNLDPDGDLDDMTFDSTNSTNAVHAIELGTSAPLTTTFRGLTSAGFNASDAQNDSFFYTADRGTDVVWTINVVGGSGNFSFKKARAGDTVNVVIDPVTTLIYVSDENGANLQNARVYLEAANALGDLPYKTAITITRSGTTATVTLNAHPFAANQKIAIRGCDQEEYNGPKTITAVTTNTFDFTVTGSPTTPATGFKVANGQDETSYDNSPTTEGTFNGGTGHAVSDVITLKTAGVRNVGVQITVDAVSSGVVTQFTVDSLLDNQVRATTDVLSQYSTTGSGSGFSLTLDSDNLEIWGTGIIIEGLTDVNGEISDNRTFTLDQDTRGRIRLATTDPKYKSSPISGTIDSATGLNLTTVMIRD